MHVAQDYSHNSNAGGISEHRRKGQNLSLKSLSKAPQRYSGMNTSHTAKPNIYGGFIPLTSGAGLLKAQERTGSGDFIANTEAEQLLL